MKRGWIPLAVGGLVLVSSLGCGSEANSETAGTTASLGCDEGSLDAGVTHIDLQYDGAARSYELYLPPAYDGFTPLPVVLSFHGFTSSGLGQQQSSGMDATAEREGFVVVYPNGLDNSWNAGICCGRSADRDIDDVGFTRAVIEDLGARGCIDTARVYATGMSNGGFLSHRLACEAADVIAAAAPVAAVLGIEGSACNPVRPIPLMHFHGTGDPLVPFAGGGLAGSPSVQESIVGWSERNGCTGEPEVTFQNGDAACETVRDCDGGVTVTLCAIEGAGHCWPGQPCPDRLGSILGDPTFDIDANEAMWELFSRSRLGPR